MSRSLRRGALAATALVFSLASLSACAAGNDAQTLGVRPDNAATSVGDVKIQNAVVITQPKADAEGPAVVSARLFNNSAQKQTLDGITLPGSSATVKLTPAKGEKAVEVPAHGSVLIGGEGNASAVIDNGREAAKNGNAQEVVFQLSETGEVKLRAFVVPATSYFEGFGPSQLPAAPEQKPSGKPSDGASEGPSGKPSDGASNKPSQGTSQEPGDAASSSTGTGR
ncbi:DUF461 domain-containing protein [Streptomyces sp. NPDC001941]|uniref:DUF461 domain-containing protein n=1 Tax=Streptomyces sp. NPDC001941 TaxID=3154659 RepID=UPI00332B83DD